MSAIFPEYVGEASALCAAFLWAAASVMYARLREHVTALQLNLLKNLLAAFMLLITLWCGGRLLPAAEFKAAGLFFISGAVGIGMGDTAYFGALKIIGARRALLLLVLSPSLTAVLSLILLGEMLSLWVWAGVAVTAAGVAWVISERAADRPGVACDRKSLGVAYGLLAAIGQALGAVTSHAAFLEVSTSPLSSVFFRLLGGIVAVSVALASKGRFRRGVFRMRMSTSSWGWLLLAVFIGTYIAIWLQQVSLKYSPAGIAQTLFATSPLFVLPLAAFQGERISLRAICGALIAVGGVVLLFAP